MKTRFRWIIVFVIVMIAVVFVSQRFQLNLSYDFGDPIDSLNHVYVYYNGKTGNVDGRNTTPDGYNLGLKYQCVEFAKRYYYQYLNHKMPDSYGHAKDFFLEGLADGKRNKQRNLTQYRNPSVSKPQVNDLVVFSPTTFNSYGHVAIISQVFDDEIEIIQQNPGRFGKSRIVLDLVYENDKWYIGNDNILGCLRK